jgi:hypothetical protein
MTASTWRARLVAVLMVTAIVALARTNPEAHKPITSKYTYNDDVFPIFRDKCSRCHIEDGVAPMSLMTYDAAVPWAESIRVELIASHMPPANALRGFGADKHANLLTAAELDTVLTWATGGNPRGSAERQLPTVPFHNDWALGPPDLSLVLPELVLPADQMEQTQDFTIAAGNEEVRWLRAADLLPGTASVVRSAVIAIKGDTGTEFGLERVLRRWLPGQDVESVDQDGAAFRLPPHAELSVRVHYKKTWQAEGQSPKDKSTVGLYFAPSPRGQDLMVVPLSASLAHVADDRRLTFTQTIHHDVAALAFSPDSVPPNITLAASALRPDGTRATLLRMHTRQDWVRRYWFEKPIAIPAGTRIEIVADLQDPDQLCSAAFGGFAPPTPAAQEQQDLRLSLDVTTLAKPTVP